MVCVLDVLCSAGMISQNMVIVTVLLYTAVSSAQMWSSAAADAVEDAQLDDDDADVDDDDVMQTSHASSHILNAWLSQHILVCHHSVTVRFTCAVQHCASCCSFTVCCNTCHTIANTGSLSVTLINLCSL